MKKLIEVLRLAEQYLREHGVESPRLNAEHLLTKVLNLDRLGLYLAFDRPLTDGELEAYRLYLRRRGGHEPLQYILGGAAFRGLIIELGRGALVPRPETEGLVQLVLDRLKIVTGNKETREQKPLRLLDLCTGTGVVGLALASEHKDLWCVCSDISPHALEWAVRNFQHMAAGLLSRVVFLCADLCTAFSPEKPVFDIVVANPPYVGPVEMDALAEEIIHYEPQEALRGGGPDGTAVSAAIIAAAPRLMRPGALLALEIGETQREALEKVFDGCNAEYAEPEFHRDLAGKFRYVTAFRK